jgi:ATP-dependent Clp protease ATP-binding subunit ClpA
MNYELFRRLAEGHLDQLLAQQKAGKAVSPSQIKEADEAWTDAANAANKACFKAELAQLAPTLNEAVEGLEAAHKAIRGNLHRQDLLRQQRLKLDAALATRRNDLNRLNDEYEKVEELLAQCS